MTEHQSNLIHTMMATLLAHIHPNESTRRTNKLRKSIRLKLGSIHKKDIKYYASMAAEAQAAWDKVEKKINDKDYEVLMSSALLAMYSFVRYTPYKEAWFREKVFEEAIASIEGCYNNPHIEDLTAAERDSNMLADLLAEVMGISRPATLSTLRRRVSNELLLKNISYTPPS